MNNNYFLLMTILVLQSSLLADTSKNLDYKSNFNQDATAEKKRMDLLSKGRIASWHLECRQLADSYLKCADKGEFSGCWNQSDPLLQKALTQEEWQRDVLATKFYLGNVKSRLMKEQRILWDPKNMPEGPYIVIEYEARSDQDIAMTEIITMKKGADEKWRILMYQISESAPFS